MAKLQTIDEILNDPAYIAQEAKERAESDRIQAILNKTPERQAILAKLRAKSVAQTISARFNDDGTIFVDKDGVTLKHACESVAQVVTRYEERDATRYVFRDESVITIAGDAWDFGFLACSCFEGAGHDTYCENRCEHDGQQGDCDACADDNEVEEDEDES